MEENWKRKENVQLFLDLSRNIKKKKKKREIIDSLIFNMDLLWMLYLSDSPGVLENSISG